MNRFDTRSMILVGLVSFTLAVGHYFSLQKPTESAAVNNDPFIAQRFEKEIWPLLARETGGASCVKCHDADNTSELHFFSDAESSFTMLLEKGYLVLDGPDSLLGRILSHNPKKRMPRGKSMESWPEKDVATLRAFLTDLQSHSHAVAKADEQFPRALLTPYRALPSDQFDNQFITYRQLKGKIQTIFNDDWKRNERDLFAENIAMFGGADFKERFNESAKASATFLSGLEVLSRDVASRAYAMKTGPFVGRNEQLPSPALMENPDAACEREITRLYQTILFRSPTRKEIQDSFAFLKNVYRAETEIRGRDLELAFKLTVEDKETGLKATRTVNIPVSGETHGVYQELIDESEGGTNRFGLQRLAKAFTFKPGDDGQLFRIANVNTIGNVSFHGLIIKSLNGDSNLAQRILASDAAVQADGAWKIRTGDGDGDSRRGRKRDKTATENQNTPRSGDEFVSYEDENNDKGNSSIVAPISVKQAGQYELTVLWRKNSDNARNVLVEVFSHDTTALAKPPLPEIPARGEARYFIDVSDDTRPYADLQASFQFAESDYVEINNRGTRKRVTTDATRFVAGKTTITVDNDEAEGAEMWEVFNAGQFKAYNQVGKNAFTDPDDKSKEVWLRYKPSVKKDQWKPDTFYEVKVGYAAKQGNEYRTPVIVKAAKSSPIIQLSYPARARAEALVEIDASTSYTVQSSQLKFTWQQIDGPAISTSDWNAPVLKFAAPRLSVQQAAWEGLARALLRHPDFLFTRPPSLQTVSDKHEKQHLQLMKIALDLVGRPPTPAELDKLAKGVSLEKMIDDYLQSQEFKDFYFHRIRLYVESHGTETQDEPARLWCYVAFNDRPFQEILTADYTVDANFQKQLRPAFHGKTGLLTTKGFIEGKPGLPHFNYAAQVAELFLGYVFEVPPEIVAQRDGITAVATTDPNSLCYSCHKVLTPLAFQRTRWDDDGRYRLHDDYGLPIDDSDNRLVSSYPFAGDGMEAFALQAVKKERFIRTMINTHFTFYFGRGLRYEEDERGFYKRLWDAAHRNNFTIRGLIRSILNSPEYLEGKGRVKASATLAKTE